MIHRISLRALESPFPRGDGSPSKAPDYYMIDADKTSKACHYERALLGDRTGVQLGSGARNEDGKRRRYNPSRVRH